MRPATFVLLALLCMTAQASEPLPPVVEQPPPDPAADAPGRLIFSRDENAPNACDVELYVNQQVVASLGPGEYTRLDVPSGELSLAAAMSPDGYCGGNGPDSAQSILLRPGQTRQFAVMVGPDQVFLAPRLD